MEINSSYSLRITATDMLDLVSGCPSVSFIPA